MKRLISKHEFDKTMDDYSQLYCTEPPLNMGVWSTPAMRGGSQKYNLEPAKLSSTTTITMSDPLASAFHATESYMDFQQQYEHQVGNSPLASQFPTYNSHILLCQSSGCSTDSADQADSNYDFRDSLQSLVKSHLCNNQSYGSNSSSDMSNKVPCNNSSKPFPHDQNMLLGENAAFVIREQLSLPSHANRGLNVCHGSSSKPTPSNKKRIRWTQDLHEQFVKCVNRLGGAEKATPKAILKLMDSNLLTIFNVKSHLQKYRTAVYMPDYSVEEISKRRTRKEDDMPQLHMKISMQMKEALQLQLEVERHLHEQLEVQQNLQLMIEEHQRQLKMMFDQQKKNGKSLFKSQNSNLLSQNDHCTSSEDA